MIMCTTKTRDIKKPHKNGIEAPVTPDKANRIDRKNGNNFWRKSIEIEMHEVGTLLDVFHEKEKVSYGSSKATGHIMFDVKMEFTHTDRRSLDGHSIVIRSYL